jgi:putative DNA primase/helicase
MPPPDGTEQVRRLVEDAREVRLEDLATTVGDEAEITRLAVLTPIAYERERDAAAKRLGCRVSILDRLIVAAQGADIGNPAGRGRSLQLADIEPFPKPVDGAALLDEIARAIGRYVVLDEFAAVAVALWIVHAHAIDAAYVSPRLAITSPEKRCGKTTLLTVFGALVARALATANMTTATIFRVIEAVRPTLLIDEADSFLGDADEMRGVINAGHCRATATVLRTVETRDGYEVRGFSVWGAMALAAIGRLPGTIEDRSIKIAMRRRRPDEPAERLRLDRLDGLAPIARRAARWATDHFDALRAADPDVPAELHDRAADNWRSLLAIADAAGGGWPERARRAAVFLARDGADDAETARTMLLADIKAAFDAQATDRLASEEIVAHLMGLDDRPWPEFRGGRAITKVQLAKLLKPLRISSGTIRLDDGRTPKGYHRRAFEDAFARYLPPEQNAATPQPADSAALGENRNATSGNGVAFRNPAKPKESSGCGVVAAQRPTPGPNGAAHERDGDLWGLEI